MQIDRPIAIVLTLFIILLLVFFLVLPEYNTFGNLQVQLGEKKAEFNAEFDYYAAIAKAYSDLQSHQSDIQKIDNALPSAPPVLGDTVYFLQKTAKENGMIVKSMALSKSSPANVLAGNNASDVKDMVFSMDVLGDYASLENFIASLEKSSRIFEITSISFGSALGGASSAAQSGPSQSQFQIQQTYSFSLQIKTHSY